MGKWIRHLTWDFIIRDLPGRTIRISTRGILRSDNGTWSCSFHDPSHKGQLAVTEGVYFLDRPNDKIIFTYEDDYDYIGLEFYKFFSKGGTQFSWNDYEYNGYGWIKQPWVLLFEPGTVEWKIVQIGTI